MPGASLHHTGFTDLQEQGDVLMIKKKTITSVPVETFKDKAVLVRVDFNVPQHEDGSVADDSRIRATLPTIKHLRDAGAKIVLCSHLGRPKGDYDEKYSMRPIATRLSQHLTDMGGSKAIFMPEVIIGDTVGQTIEKMKAGEVFLLDNVRFHPGEERNDQGFAKALAEFKDVFVNDAFGAAHRAHASTEGVSHFLRPALCGSLMEKEIEMLSRALDPMRPFATIIGGAKVSTKMGVLQNLLNRVDVLAIGGAMAFTFLKGRGLNVGKSLVEDAFQEYCKKLEKEAENEGVNLILPVDVVCVPSLSDGPKPTPVVTTLEEIPPDQMGVDIGPKTLQAINSALAPCKTIIWNGPLGVFEKGYDVGTFGLIDQLVALTKKGATTIVGGGDSVAALKEKGVPDSAFTWVSTGGGASLEFLEGLELPGIKCLDEAEASAPSQTR